MMALGVGCFGFPMLHAESTEIGTLQQSRRDGRRIVPAEIPSAAGGSRYSARHPLTSCVDHRKLVPSRHRRCRSFWSDAINEAVAAKIQQLVDAGTLPKEPEARKEYFRQEQGR